MNGRSTVPAPRVSVDAASLRARAAELEGLRVSDVSYRAGFDSTWHSHEHPCATLVLGGAVSKELRRRERILTAGAVATTPSEVAHADRFGPRGGRVAVVELLGHAEQRPLPNDTLRTEALRLPWLGRRIARELAASDEGAPLALQAAVFELLAILARAGSDIATAPPRWLDDVVDHLHAHLFERPTLVDLAAVGGVHRTHLVRSFRASFGVSIGDYARRLRIEWAAEALLADDTPIAQIAAQAGFSDQSHFTRVFASHVGTTPARYRCGPRGSGPVP